MAIGIGLGLVMTAGLAAFVLFYGNLFRLWILLRGEGKFGVDQTVYH